jgi:hypothetical protein
MRLGRLMQQGQELGVTFETFERERRPRAERVVALARRNGNQKREFGAAGAWIRDHLMKLLIPVTAKGMDWMYAYDPRTAGSRRRTHKSAGRTARQSPLCPDSDQIPQRSEMTRCANRRHFRRTSIPSRCLNRCRGFPQPDAPECVVLECTDDWSER